MAFWDHRCLMAMELPGLVKRHGSGGCSVMKYSDIFEFIYTWSSSGNEANSTAFDHSLDN